MIRSFRHAGLEKFFYTGSKAGIQPAHAAKLNRQLTVLNIANDASRMDVPGWDLHALKGDLAGHWSVKVNANWRMALLSKMRTQSLWITGIITEAEEVL